MPHPSAQPAWRVQWIDTDDKARALAEDVRCAAFDPSAVDVALLVAETNSSEALHVLTDHEGARLMGIAPFRATAARIDISAGPLPFYRARIMRFHPLQHPIIARKAPRQALAACLSTLATMLPPKSAVFFDALPVGSDLQRILTDPAPEVRAHYFVLPWGAPYEHFKIKWTGTLDGYLKSLTSKNRWNMKHPIRKIEERSAEIRVRRFQGVDELEDFFRDGMRVSEKTYQKRRLGSGLVRGGDRETKMRLAAERRNLRAHILYLAGEPVAFQYAILRGRTLYGIEQGYDPALAHLQIGNVLFFKMLEDLERCRDQIDLIDMLTYDSVFKHRASNVRVAVQNYYLFPRTSTGRLMYSRAWIGTHLRSLGVRLARDFHLADRVRRWTREQERQPKE